MSLYKYQSKLKQFDRKKSYSNHLQIQTLLTKDRTITKLSNLLEQFNTQNQFLNKQVKILIQQNHLLKLSQQLETLKQTDKKCQKTKHSANYSKTYKKQYGDSFTCQQKYKSSLYSDKKLNETGKFKSDVTSKLLLKKQQKSKNQNLASSVRKNLFHESFSTNFQNQNKKFESFGQTPSKQETKKNDNTNEKVSYQIQQKLFRHSNIQKSQKKIIQKTEEVNNNTELESKVQNVIIKSQQIEGNENKNMIFNNAKFIQSRINLDVLKQKSKDSKQRQKSLQKKYLNLSIRDKSPQINNQQKITSFNKVQQKSIVLNNPTPVLIQNNQIPIYQNTINLSQNITHLQNKQNIAFQSIPTYQHKNYIQYKTYQPINLRRENLIKISEISTNQTKKNYINSQQIPPSQPLIYTTYTPIKANNISVEKPQYLSNKVYTEYIHYHNQKNPQNHQSVQRRKNKLSLTTLDQSYKRNSLDLKMQDRGSQKNLNEKLQINKSNIVDEKQLKNSRKSKFLSLSIKNESLQKSRQMNKN